MAKYTPVKSAFEMQKERIKYYNKTYYEGDIVKISDITTSGIGGSKHVVSKTGKLVCELVQKWYLEKEDGTKEVIDIDDKVVRLWGERKMEKIK